jgi:hypothetical protein
MPAEPRYRRIGQTNSQMTNAQREASIAAIKASAKGKLVDSDRREDDHKRAMRELAKKNESVFNKGTPTMNNTILEYLEGYFGGELNESTSDEDIMEAFNELLETADAVADYLQEFIGTGNSIKRGAAVPPKYKHTIRKTGPENDVNWRGAALPSKNPRFDSALKNLQRLRKAGKPGQLHKINKITGMVDR